MNVLQTSDLISLISSLISSNTTVGGKDRMDGWIFNTKYEIKDLDRRERERERGRRKKRNIGFQILK